MSVLDDTHDPQRRSWVASAHAPDTGSTIVPAEAGR